MSTTHWSRIESSPKKQLPHGDALDCFQWTVCVVLAVVALSAMLLPADCVSREPVPEVKDLRFEPARPISGDKVKLYIKMENAIRAEVRWAVNDGDEHLTDYDGVGDSVELNKSLKSGDTLKAVVTPFDGMANPGKAVTKSVKCFNSPPVLKLAGQKLDGYTYKAKIDVNDPEKGKVTLTVEGPDGMQIDPEGNVTWRLRKDTEGDFPIKVVAKDEEGAEAVLTYSIRISQRGGRRR